MTDSSHVSDNFPEHSTGHNLFHPDINFYKIDTVIINAILRMKNLRHREMNWFIESHPRSKWGDLRRKKRIKDGIRIWTQTVGLQNLCSLPLCHAASQQGWMPAWKDGDWGLDLSPELTDDLGTGLSDELPMAVVQKQTKGEGPSVDHSSNLSLKGRGKMGDSWIGKQGQENFTMEGLKTLVPIF